jgi:hypothetical protein
MCVGSKVQTCSDRAEVAAAYEILTQKLLEVDPEANSDFFIRFKT